MAQGVKGTIVHGTRSCYMKGCRKPECTEANTAWKLDYRRRRYGEGKESAGVTQYKGKQHDDMIDTILELLHAG